MDRRQALSGAVVAAAGMGVGAMGAEQGGDVSLQEIDTMANVCAHEHWGSLAAIGAHASGFVADELAGAESDQVDLFDLLFCPYLHGHLAAGGFDMGPLALQSGHSDIIAMARSEPAKVIAAVLPHLRDQRSTGTVTCLTLGLRLLYGFDLDGLSVTNYRGLSDRINLRYRNTFGWYRQAMEAAHLEGPYRPNALSFLFERAEPAAAAREMSFTRALIRVDEYLAPSHRANPRFRYAMGKVGIEPTDAASWRAFVDATMEAAREAGCIGIKQAQAYRRDLDFQHVDDGEVDFTAESGPPLRGLQNWVIHRFCERANDYGWPFQIHVGTHNLPRSNPLPLAGLMTRYPGARFVMLHTWPYLAEAATLAKHHPNAYIDICWLPILSPGHAEAALRTYLGYVPGRKLMLSQDATSVELAAGSTLVYRALLRKVLAERVDDGLLSEEHALELARWALAENARAVYRT